MGLGNLCGFVASCESEKRRRGLPLRLRNIFVDILREHVERDIAALDDDIVIVAQVVFRPERGLRAAALAADFAVHDLVAARLPRPAAIAIDLARELERVRDRTSPRLN